MPVPFPFSLTPRYKKIAKLIKSPMGSIKKWLFEKTKIITTDPVKKKRKKTKEKEIHVTNLQTVIRQIATKVDEIIDAINGIPELEKMIITEVKFRMKEIERIEDLILKTVEPRLNAKRNALDKRLTLEDIKLERDLRMTEVKLERDLRTTEAKLERKHILDINNLETKLKREIKKLSDRLDSLGTRHDLEIKQLVAKHDKDIKEGADELEDHKYKRIRYGMGSNYVHNLNNRNKWDLERYYKYKKGGKFQRGGGTKLVITTRKDNLKRKLIKDIERLQK